MAGFATESATARLARLLTMVPWLVNRQGIDLRQAADDLGVSVDQITYPRAERAEMPAAS